MTTPMAEVPTSCCLRTAALAVVALLGASCGSGRTAGDPSPVAIPRPPSATRSSPIPASSRSVITPGPAAGTYLCGDGTLSVVVRETGHQRTVQDAVISGAPSLPIVTLGEPIELGYFAVVPRANGLDYVESEQETRPCRVHVPKQALP